MQPVDQGLVLHRRSHSEIANNLLVIVLTYADDPRLALVNKQFCIASQQAYEQRWYVIIRANQNYPQFIPRAIKFAFSGMNREGLVISVQKMIKIATQIHQYEKRPDESLTILFDCMMRELKRLNLEKPRPFEGTVRQRAEQMRKWMQGNPDILDKVVYLKMNNRNIYEVSPEIALLPNLKQLDLSENYLRVICPEIGHLTRLTTLNLSGNELNDLPRSISDLQKLTDLSIRHNRFQVLPKSLFLIATLTSLDVSENQIIGFPAEIGGFSRLRSLSASGNQIKVLPEEICELTHLDVELDLSENQLQCLPASMGKLCSLQRLNLNRNKLKNLPFSMGQMKCLESIDLSDNRFKYLPEAIKSLASLREMEMTSNPVHPWPKGFGRLERIVWLPPGRYIDPTSDPY